MNPFANLQNNTQQTTEVVQSQITPEYVNQLQDQIAKGAKLLVIPKGSKGLIVRKEISPELKASVEAITKQMQTLGGIDSQTAAATANAVLKQAKNLVKELENERKKMDQLLNDEKADNKQIEATIVGQLSALVQVVNNNITAFQAAEEKKARERAAELQRKKDEEMAAAQKERDRVANIKSLILKFEGAVLAEVNGATIDTIDSLISRLDAVKISKDVYMEFYDEAEKMYIASKVKLQTRKEELIKYSELEKQNKEQADLLKKQQEEQALKAKQELEEKAEELETQKAEKEMSDVANIQMEHELKISMNTGAKGVQKRWTFDEETIDMSLLPDEFKTFNKEAITKAIANGLYEIPGVNIYQKIINVSR